MKIWHSQQRVAVQWICLHHRNHCHQYQNPLAVMAIKVRILIENQYLPSLYFHGNTLIQVSQTTVWLHRYVLLTCINLGIIVDRLPQQISEI